MSNTERRKLTKRSAGAYITVEQRAANKIEDGKSTLPLSRTARRYISKMNRYYRKTSGGSWAHPEQLTCA